MDMQCPICQVEFAPRDPRQKCCSKKCGVKRYEQTGGRRAQGKQKWIKHGARYRAENNKRYREDPVYREKFVGYMRQRRIEHPEKVRESNEKNRSKPENRIRARKVSKTWHATNRDYANPRRQVRQQRRRNTHPWSILVKGAQARSREFGHAFDLTDEWATTRWTGYCELTGLPFDIGNRGVKRRLWAASLDKIDPTLGYIQSNCRFVLWAINAFKSNGTDEQMYLVAEALLLGKAIIPRTLPHLVEKAQTILAQKARDSGRIC